MKLRVFLPLFALSGVWGISFLMIRIADTTFPPLWVALLRCALGAVLMWAILVMRGNRLPPRSHLPWLLLVALLNNALPFTCFALGEKTVPSNIAAVLNATVPIWTLMLTIAFERRHATLASTAGVLIAFAGVVVVVVTHGDEPGAVAESANLLGGTLIIGLATLSYAIATVVAKAKLRGLDPIGLATMQLSLASLMLLPFALGGEHPSALRAAPVGAIAVLGFAGSGIAYLLYYRLLPVISATQLAAVTYIMPIWGVFWGLLAQEKIVPGTYVGVAVTIAGLVLLNLRSGAATAAPKSPPRSSAPAARDPE
ncbi:MAG: DMT family transporter [Steroidobacterales bacterium]